MRFWPFGKKLETKYSGVGANIAYTHVGLPVYTPRDYESLSREAYLYNAVSFRCVKMIASAAASVEWCLYGQDGKEIEDHPMLDLLKAPAPGISGASFFEAVVAYFLLAGNTYLEAVGPVNGPPRELWTLRPDRMQIIPGKFGIPSGYRYTVNGLLKDWKSDPLTGAGPILHMKDFHPTEDYYGMSRIEAAAYGIDRHNAASAHNNAMLNNGARPSGALVFKTIKVGDSVQSAPQELVDAASKKLMDSHTGPKNAGKTFVFNSDVDWLNMSTTPKDMDFQEGKNDAARDICNALGVPHILLVPGASTYNNVREAKLELYEETVLPILDLLTNALNWWLAPRFGEGLHLKYDEDEIAALEPRRETKRTTILDLYDKNLITSEEAREALQYGPRDKDAVGKVDASLISALITGIDKLGMEPLVRYMKSVGLVDANTTPESLLDAAMSYVDDTAPDPADLAAATLPGAPPAAVPEKPATLPAIGAQNAA